MRRTFNVTDRKFKVEKYECHCASSAQQRGSRNLTQSATMFYWRSSNYSWKILGLFYTRIVFSLIQLLESSAKSASASIQMIPEKAPPGKEK